MILPEDPDGYAIPQADLLSDWYAEHGDDPESDPMTWPSWTDSVRVELGPEPEPELDLPTEADWADYILYLERLEYEIGCNMRFAD